MRFGFIGVMCLLGVAGSLGAATLDFEDADDSAVITTQYSGRGATFSGFVACKDGTLFGGCLNEFEIPPRSGFTVLLNFANETEILFSTPATFIEFYSTYGGPFTVEAFDASDASLGTISSAFSTNYALSGDLGSTPNERFEFSTSGVARLAFTAVNSDFSIDDLTFEPSVNAVPEPSAVAVLPVALGGFWFLRRRLTRVS